MKTSIWTLIVGTGMVITGPSQGAAATNQPTQDAEHVANKLIRETLKQGEDKVGAEERAVYEQAFPAVLAQSKGNVLVSDLLEKALAKGKEHQDPEEGAKVLRLALREGDELLSFKPRMEAPLAEGFPRPVPVGEIQVKKYPRYRMARASINEGGNAFFTLFSHIKQNDVAMTAPVEITCEKKADRMNRVAMAFLYENPRQGKAGQQGPVQVMDVKPMTTVSIGIRGNADQEQVSQAESYLREWLKRNQKHYRATGPLRVMGYNSPFVPQKLRYSEVEIPIEEVK